MIAFDPASPSAQSEMESARLLAVDQTCLLDTPDEVAFDELVTLAAEICGTSMSAFSLIASDRQWIKAGFGVPVREIPLHLAFCRHTVLQDDLLVVEDMTVDDRFRDNALVTAQPNIRFYASMPLGGWSAAHVGTLCVLDTVPRRLKASQYQALKVLARQVQSQIEIRMQQQRLEEAVRERDKVVSDLRSSDYRFRTFMDNAPFLAFIKDDEGRFLFYNDRMAQVFGVGKTAWIGKNVHDLFPAELADAYRANDLEAIDSGCLVARVEDVVDSLGCTGQWKSHKFPWLNVEGKSMLGCISIDLTSEMKQQRALEVLCGKLEYLAATDGLTGLANRRVLDDRVQLAFQSARRYQSPLSVVLLDIDNFKKRNDQFGHAAGDLILQRMGALIRGCARETDLAARYGGEEFVVVLPNTDGDGATQFAERLKAAMEQESWPGGPVTASIGTASLDHWTVSGERLVALADDAMYEVKCTGKNRILSHRELIVRTREKMSDASALLVTDQQRTRASPARA